MHRSSGLQRIGIEMRVERGRESELGSAGMRVGKVINGGDLE